MPSPARSTGTIAISFGKAAAGGPLERRLDLDLLHRKLARRLHGEDGRGLEQRLPEGAVPGRAVAQDREAVGEDGVVDDDHALRHGATCRKHALAACADR